MVVCRCYPLIQLLSTIFLFSCARFSRFWLWKKESKQQALERHFFCLYWRDRLWNIFIKLWQEIPVFWKRIFKLKWIFEFFRDCVSMIFEFLCDLNSLCNWSQVGFLLLRSISSTISSKNIAKISKYRWKRVQKRRYEWSKLEFPEKFIEFIMKERKSKNKRDKMYN